MRESLEQLAGQVGERAGAAMVSSAVVPVAGGVISAGEHVIDQIDELTDDLGKAIPGGGVINRVADVALLPGRYLVGVARTALEGLSDEVKSPDQPSSIQSRPRKVSGPKWAVRGMKPSRFRSGKASEIDVRSRDRDARTGDEVSVSFNAPGHRAQRHGLTDGEADGLRVLETEARAVRSTS